jgi:hypothetical protein
MHFGSASGLSQPLKVTALQGAHRVFFLPDRMRKGQFA